MFITYIAPITKIPLQSPQIFTYFSARKVQAGALISARLKTRQVLGIVIDVQNLNEEKMAVKEFPFGLKKIANITQYPFKLNKSEIELAFWISDYYYSPLGIALKTIIPSYILRKKNIGNKAEPLTNDDKKQEKHTKKQPIAALGKTRFDYYEKIIKRTIEKGGQVLFLVPETNSLKSTEEKINLKLRCNTAILSSELSPKEYYKSWLKARQGTAEIIIGTRGAVFGSFKSLSQKIEEHESSPYYKSWDQTPKYSAKKVALKIARQKGIKIVLGGSTISVDSYWRVKRKEYNLTGFSQNGKKLRKEIIDMKAELKSGNFCVLSKAVVNELNKAIGNGKQSMLFVNRRGTSTFIMCRDCGYVAVCKKCASPLVYHYKKMEGKLICHWCSYADTPPQICPRCKSYKIKYFGAGAEKVEKELMKIFPDARALRIDSDNARNPKNILQIINKFKKGKAEILIGTQMMLKELILPKVDFSAIVSIETVLNLPNYKSEEEAFRILSKMESLTKRKMLIQTYKKDNPLFHDFINNSIESIYSREIENRKQLSYPPFSQIIKAFLKGRDNEKARTHALIVFQKLKMRRKNLKMEDQILLLGPAPAFIPKVKNYYIWNIILKNFDASIRGIEQRNELLKTIPSNWSIDVDPEDAL